MVNEELELLYLENAPKLVNCFVGNHKDSAKYFDTLEDMKQSLLLKIWQKLPKYDKSKGRFSTYVYIICYSEMLSQIRTMKTHKRRLSLESSSLDKEVEENITLIDILGIDANYHEKYCSYEQYIKVIELLNKEAYLHFVKGCNYKEISKIVGVSTARVGHLIRTNIVDIRNQLTQEYQGYEPD